MTGLKAGAKNGFLAEYKRARGAIYYSLTEEKRDEVLLLCKTWNRTGIPLSIKKKYLCACTPSLPAWLKHPYRQYDRNCKRLLHDVAMTCLKRYGVYVYFYLVGQPGVGINADMCVHICLCRVRAHLVLSIDFSADMGLGGQLYKDDTVSKGSLGRLQAFVHRNAGEWFDLPASEHPLGVPRVPVLHASFKGYVSGDGVVTTESVKLMDPAGTGELNVTGKKKKAHRMDKPDAYQPHSDRFRNQNHLEIRAEDFPPNMTPREVKNVLYSLFRYAHGELPCTAFGTQTDRLQQTFPTGHLRALTHLGRRLVRGS